MDKFVALALVRRRMLPYKATLPALIPVRDTNFCGQKQQTTHFYSGDPQPNYRAEKIHTISGWSGSYNRSDDSLRVRKEKATFPALVSARTTNFHGQKQKIYYGPHLRADNIRTSSGRMESRGDRDDFPKFPKGDLDEFETYKRLREGLHFKIRCDGGNQHPKKGDTVYVDYTEYDQEGTKLDFKTTDVIVGDNKFGPGFDEAIRNIKIGDHATFIIHEKYWPSYGTGKGKYKVYYVTLIDPN